MSRARRSATNAAYLCILSPDGTPSRRRARRPPPTAAPSFPGTMCHCARGERTARQSLSFRTIFGCLSRSSRTRFDRIEALPVAQLDRCYTHAERAVVTGGGDMCIARQQNLEAGRRQPAAVQHERLGPAAADGVVEQHAAVSLDAEPLRLPGHHHVNGECGRRRFRIDWNIDPCLPGGPAARTVLGVFQPMETSGRGAQQRTRRVKDQIDGARFAISDIRFRQGDGAVGALPDREHRERIGARLQQTGIDDRLPGAVAA